MSTPSQRDLAAALALARSGDHAGAAAKTAGWPDPWRQRVQLVVAYREGQVVRAAAIARELAEAGWWDAPVAAVLTLFAPEPEVRVAAARLVRSWGGGSEQTVELPVAQLLEGNLGAWAVYLRGMVQARRFVDAFAAATLASGTGRFGPELWSMLAGELLLDGEVGMARHALREGLARAPAEPDLIDALAILDDVAAGGPTAAEEPTPRADDR